ncbi:unnamed protein product [Mycena citricolor]|uniref:Glucose-methanol-choline oxidoreductase N-terminal domain-containing protein n=1 Tax=Mycena citricolor TaxID=2018698 RepID=A0AAD2HBT3_9AGAR|nr:unnamed protein product [Mycena citricolor]CAK5273006.1 unnamed protein product [Mycena citricolor]
MTAPHSLEPSYDLVFAGGGTAACVTAGRLAKAFPDLKILLLESGPSTKDVKDHVMAGQYLKHLMPTSKVTQFTQSQPSESVNGRSVIVPSGRCVGGGSSINFMLYNRPAKSDFDAWENDFGNAGWSGDDLIPLLAKAETYEVDPARPTHGSTGPLRVSSLGGHTLFPIAKEFLEIGPQVEKKRPLGKEGNSFGPESLNVFFPMPKWISSDGRRSDAAHYYVFKPDYPNLTVADGCIVNKIVVENGVATGVEYLFNKNIHEDASQDIRTVKATKLVVVSAGAMGSPLILERSGIGRKDILEKAGIPIVSELSGVGDNYQDHTFAVTPYIAMPDAPTMDPVYRGEPETWGPGLADWEQNSSGIFATNGVDAAIKIRPFPEELAEIGPEFTETWNKQLRDYPDRPLFWLSNVPGLPGDQSALPPLRFLCSACFLGYPSSRGYLHISSADPYAHPDFQAGFLSDPADVAAMRWGYKKGREIIRRLPSFASALPPAGPQFGEGSNAAYTEKGPVPIDAPKIVYSAEDDKAIDAYLRQWVQTTWHSLGTCAMKPKAEGGVVDSKLNVYGVSNLKVDDLSIAPSNVSANTYSATVAIGEKAAVIIAKELGGSL